VKFHLLANDVSVIPSWGTQPTRLIDSRTAFKLTALRQDMDRFEQHTQRLLLSTPLHQIAWINIRGNSVTFTMLDRNKVAGRD